MTKVYTAAAPHCIHSECTRVRMGGVGGGLKNSFLYYILLYYVVIKFVVVVVVVPHPPPSLLVHDAKKKMPLFCCSYPGILETPIIYYHIISFENVCVFVYYHIHTLRYYLTVV